jgi:hypothetical protein
MDLHDRALTSLQTSRSSVRRPPEPHLVAARQRASLRHSNTSATQVANLLGAIPGLPRNASSRSCALPASWACRERLVVVHASTAVAAAGPCRRRLRTGAQPAQGLSLHEHADRADLPSWPGTPRRTLYAAWPSGAMLQCDSQKPVAFAGARDALASILPNPTACTTGSSRKHLQYPMRIARELDDVHLQLEGCELK